MKVDELIVELQKMNGESNVFMGYDGNVVVTEPLEVIKPTDEELDNHIWWRVKSGDVVILCKD